MVVVVAVVVTTGAAVAVSTGAAAGLWETDRADGGHVDPPPATARLTRQTLVDTETESGDLGYGAATTVDARLDGVLTWLPEPGTSVDRGQALYRVDDTPVVLL
ncbi:hypothetical protein CLV43_12148 [Umezawaea tangerina]|uniref:Biotin/lipoyl-binding protein n=1 Tax=Umezawaea tangerina TaxID=84725 RepID=A0A2T0SGA8_9PSEU|nr:hypothetical protein CLV43_12148 [Umezawaea tangerina]